MRLGVRARVCVCVFTRACVSCLDSFLERAMYRSSVAKGTAVATRRLNLRLNQTYRVTQSANSL